VAGTLSRAPTLLPLPQIMAAVRCKRSKWWFLVRTFFGKDWQEHELFYPPTDVRAGTCPLHQHLPCMHSFSARAIKTSPEMTCRKPTQRNLYTPPHSACCSCRKAFTQTGPRP